jgi:hypothetical protein
MEIVDFLVWAVVSTLVSGGTAWALLHFFGQRLIDHRLAKDLEKYKIELGEKTEALKTQLSIFAHEQNVAASRVDVQRAAAISNVYACIRDVVNPVSSIVAGSPIMNGTEAQSAQYYLDNAQSAHRACGVLANRLADLAIYFDNETYLKIRDFAKVAMDAAGKYLDSLLPLVATSHPAADILRVAEAGRAALREQFEKEMKTLAMQLAGVFRAQLGVERSTKAKESV